jgi:hypothetical protein
MKKLFTCETCGAIYSEETKAVQCETKHKNNNEDQLLKKLDDAKRVYDSLKKEYDETYGIKATIKNHVKEKAEKAATTLMQYGGKFYIDGKETSREEYLKALADFELGWGNGFSISDLLQ